MGHANYTPTAYYWVWSACGPSYSGLEHGIVWHEGIARFPMQGDHAERAVNVGYQVTPYEPGSRPAGWEQDGGGWRPIFEVRDEGERTGDFPAVPSVMPDRLPDEWTEFVSNYTAGGRLKRSSRGELDD